MNEIEKKITKARIKLFFDQPFFGNLTMGMQLIDATDWIPTAATDGRKIYYNRDFFNDLSVPEIVFVLCHEVLHVAYDHLGRRSHRDAGWWNMAADYVINAVLIKEKIGTMPTKPVEDPNEKGKEAGSQRVGLYNPKYEGWNSEKVYEDLEKRKVKKELSLDVHLEPGSGKGGHDPNCPVHGKNKGNQGKSDQDGNGGDKGQNGKDGQNGNDGKNGHGHGNSQLRCTCENHNAPGGPSLNADELDEIRDEMRARIIQAAQAAHSAGKLPASIARMINELTQPKIDWRELLAQNIQSCITDDFTWQKPNRRYMYGGIFMPSLKKDETIDICVAIDMSGSISNDMAQDFLSEVYGIMNSYSDFKIHVLCFDTKVYNPELFTPDNAEDLLTYECKGGGGTLFEAAWEYWQDNDMEPKKVVFFTDGYPGGSWGPEHFADTLWIITEGQRNQIVPPFGEYAWYEHQDGVTEVGRV